MSKIIKKFITVDLVNFTFPLAALICVAQELPNWVSVSLLTVGCIQFWARTPFKRWTNYRIFRSVSLVSALAIAAGDRTFSWQLAVGGILLLISISQEPLYKSLLQRPGLPRVMNIEGTRSPSIRTGFAIITAAHTALLLLLFAVVGTGWPGWILTAIVVVFGIGALSMGLRVGLRYSSGVDPERDMVLEAVQKTSPQFAVYFSAPPDSEFHLSMWLPYFERLGDPFIVVVRELNYLPIIAELTTAPVVYVKSIADVESILSGTVRSVFYANNGMRNSHATRLSNVTHVQLGHGESDKMSSFTPAFRMYDQIFVAGQAAIDRFKNNGIEIPDSQFKIVGRPQVTDIRVSSNSGSATDERPTVLYAPTWKGYSNDADYCSLGIAPQLIRALIEHDVNIILRPHPYTSKNPVTEQQLANAIQLLEEDCTTSSRSHQWGSAATEERLIKCFNRANALITDVSSVAADWLYSEKPIAICDTQGQGNGFTSQFPIAKGAYVVDSEGTNAKTIVESMLNADPMRDARLETKRYYLGGFPPERYSEVFLEAVASTYRTEPDLEAPTPVAVA